MKTSVLCAALLLACLQAQAQTTVTIAANAAQADAADAAEKAVAAARPAIAAASAARAHREIAIVHAGAAPMVMHLGAGNMAFAAAEMGHERIVKGAPYCADAVHETVQTLADGNRIVKSHKSRNCRDGEGRTRQEIDRDGRKSVFVRDNVNNWSSVGGGDGRHLEFRLHGNEGAHGDAAAWKEYGERAREMAQKVREDMRIEMRRSPRPEGATAPTPPTPPQPAVITEDVRDDGRGNKVIERRVMHVAGQPGLPPLPNLRVPAPVMERAMAWAPRGPGAVTSLGGKEIGGVKVNGERTTWTIEAGKIGNEKAIVTTRDVWTSPDLMVTVASRDFDPRSGEVNYRLENIKRGEPDAALFKMPEEEARRMKPRKPAASSTK